MFSQEKKDLPLISIAYDLHDSVLKITHLELETILLMDSLFQTFYRLEF